ncbi:hypothetical protein DYH09_02845 [bacterium CPR1]|nr:hypothetical protein [bacterium CPR1]
MLLLVLCLHLAALAEPGEEEFRAGNACMEKRQYREALAHYRAGLGKAPAERALLFNGGLAAYLAGDGPTAIALWQELKKREPGDWRLLAKLVQAYQLTGDLKARDQERVELMALWRKNPAAIQQKSFCREQFLVGGESVMAFESWQLEGDRAVRYTFSVLSPDGKEKYRISLGSYEATTQFGRESGELGPNDHYWHLDYYGPGEHRTYAFQKVEPTYDEVRKLVTGILEGSIKPLSSSKKSN